MSWAGLVRAVPGALTLAAAMAAGNLGRPAKAPEFAPVVSKAALDATIDAMRARLAETRRDFHRHPELSNQEARTSKAVAARLRELRLEVREGVGGHGVVALLRGEKAGGRTVGVRADMDALPIHEAGNAPYKSANAGVMHACGHDVHMTVVLGVAEALNEHRTSWGGTVKFIFQPAEEGMPVTFKQTWGALRMIEEGAFDAPKPDVVFGLHCTPLATVRGADGEFAEAPLPVGMLGYVVGPASANSDRFGITIRGRMAHGSAPQRGVDAVTVAAAAVGELQSIRSRRIDTREPLVLSMGTIHGGSRENILAEEVILTGTVRTYSSKVQDRVVELMHEILKGVTAAHGATYELDYRKGYPSIKNDADLVKATLPALRRAVGDDRVVETLPGMGGEDFSYFAQKAPGFYFQLGVANPAKGIVAGVHTAQFDVDEECLSIGVRAMTAAVLQALGAGSQ